MCGVAQNNTGRAAATRSDTAGLIQQGKGHHMSFTTGAALLDAVVLAVVSREEEGTYGYKITQEIKQALELSESTLYPVLRRLQKDGCLTIYDEPFNGRNRRYYKITPLGRQQLAGYKAEWKVYAANIDHIFGEDAK